MPKVTPVAQNHMQVVFSPEEYAQYSPMWASRGHARTWPFRVFGRTVRASFADHDRAPYIRVFPRADGFRAEELPYTSEEAAAILALLVYAARFHADHTCDASAVAAMCAAVGVESKLDTSGSSVDLTSEDPDMWRFQDQYGHPYGWSLAEGCASEAISEHIGADFPRETPENEDDTDDLTMLSDGTYIHSDEWDYVRAPFTAYMSELAATLRYVARSEANQRDREHSWALTYIMHACNEAANGVHTGVALPDTTEGQRAALRALAAEVTHPEPGVSAFEGYTNVDMSDFRGRPFGFCFRWVIRAAHTA